MKDDEITRNIPFNINIKKTKMTSFTKIKTITTEEINKLRIYFL